MIFLSLCFSSKLPYDWKQYDVIAPVYKKGDTSFSKNYKPISLSCTLCQIMEGTVKNYVLSHIYRAIFERAARSLFRIL